jgi:hypothetical protein
MKERALDREAKANLKLIQAAEKIYRMEVTWFYPKGETADTDGINSFLRLFLPTGEKRNWSYSIPDTGGGSDFSASATRNLDSGHTWYRVFRINKDGDPCCVTGPCPSDMPGCP